MASNPYVNKVELADGTTLIDITDTTAEASDVAAGSVFYAASGLRSTGTMKKGNTRIWYGTSDTAATTRNKETSITGYDAYTAGDIVIVTFVYAQDYNGVPRLNINSLGNKNILRTTGQNGYRYQWLAGETVQFLYDGTQFLDVRGGLATTTYYGRTKLATSASSTATGTALTPAALNNFSLNMVSGYPLYDAASTYAVGDMVRYSYSTYKCKTAITTAEAWNADHWDQLPAIQKQLKDFTVAEMKAL